MTIARHFTNVSVPLIMLFLFVQKISFGQCNSLIKIIDSDSPYALKKQKIDSLFTILENERNFSLAECYHDLGNKWYYQNWKRTKSPTEIDNAIHYTKMAAQLKSELVGVDPESYFQSLYNLGFFYKRDGSIYKSVDTYEKLILSAGSHIYAQYAKEDNAKIFLEIGDFDKATSYFAELAEFYKKSGEWNSELKMLILLADTYGSMDYKKQKSNIDYHLRQADSIIWSQKLEASFKANQIKILRGNLMLMTEDYESAIVQYNSVNQKVFTNAEMARVYSNLGICQLKVDEFSNSQNNLLRSIELDSTFSFPYENLGDLYLEKQEFVKGMQYYQKAIELVTNENQYVHDLKRLPDTESLELTHDKLSLLNHLTTKANGWLSYFKEDNDNSHLDQALMTFEKADELIDIIKGESNEYQSKLYWREQSSKLYMSAIEVCFLLNRPIDAYYFMERNKALLLLEDLSNEEAKEIAKITNKDAQREYDLKRNIFLSENKLQENIGLLNNDSLSILKQTIWENKYTYEKFIDSLDQTYPEYAKFKKKVDVVSLQELKSNYLAENNATLHYMLNEEDGYGLITTVEGAEFFKLDNIKVLNKEIENLIAALTNGVSDLDDFKIISNAVFCKLIPKKVYDRIRGRRLTIIPDYTLQQIPFETLVVDSDNLRYLFQEVEIAYAYSASLLQYTGQQQNKSSNDFLGLAPITFGDLKLPELYFSEKEVNSIAGVFSGETLLNGQASKANFIKNANNHNILHLATHADIGDGDNPWIAFSDSKMYLKEIYATKNQVDMVVLSACNTSTGELRRGEGVMSLARGFFYSGAKSVVSTLWPVADEAGKDILINFYKNLNNGLTKSKALQKAKLEYLNTTEEEELKHPYYWAGFVVLGDNSPVSDKPTSPWLLLGLGLLGTVILTFGYKKIKAHRAAA